MKSPPNVQDVLDCGVKDESGLNDFQKLPRRGARAIPRVGIERFRIPLKFHTQGHVHEHDAEASMFVSLPEEKMGVNMSRLCLILQEEAARPADKKFFLNVLHRYRDELRDHEGEPLLSRAELSVKFSYPVKQESLKSGHSGHQYYPVCVQAVATEEGPHLAFTVGYEYSSTCPCSLSMTKQYEREFHEGKTSEGRGVASAHAQRSLASVTCLIDLGGDFFFEECILLLRKTIPTETQVIAKRVDEKAFAVLSGEHPLFVEHVARDLSSTLNQCPSILNWKAKIEHFESLHGHNAVASIHKNPPPQKGHPAFFGL